MEVTDQKRRISGKQMSLFYKGFRHSERESGYRILSPLRLPVPPRRQLQKLVYLKCKEKSILFFEESEECRRFSPKKFPDGALPSGKAAYIMHPAK